jgi:transposase-like protein
MAIKTVSRRKYTAEFKAKVAFEALQERSTLSEISERHGIHPNLVSGVEEIRY